MLNALPRDEFPELFYGIVSPVGVETHETIEAITSYLEETKYKVELIRITDGFRTFSSKFKPWVPLSNYTRSERIDTFIRYGNQLRETFKDNSLLADAGIYQIVNRRISALKGNDIGKGKKYVGIAYIVYQLKRQEEVDVFRLVYGNLFTQISVYSRRENRIDALSRQFSSDKTSANFDDFREEAESFVKRDFNERSIPFGQRVSKIFHDADLIVSNDVLKKDVSHQVRRYLDLQFGANFISPTKAEYGMYSAKGAALRSLDLSRQVGAAIFTKSSEIISLGSNEVPKGGGGTYWGDDDHDDREYKRKSDANDTRKLEILKEIFNLSKQAGFVGDFIFDEFIENKLISDSRVMDALEYGRIIHAEMNAITDAARLGRALMGSILYCTTFPCHMCAKHIVASGVSAVVFLEPYPKSLAKDLHSDSIGVEGGDRARFRSFKAVDFEHFYGVTPRRYRELFERTKRKNESGVFKDYISSFRSPNLYSGIPYHYVNEIIVLKRGEERFLATKHKRRSEFS